MTFNFIIFVSSMLFLFSYLGREIYYYRQQTKGYSKLAENDRDFWDSLL